MMLNKTTYRNTGILLTAMASLTLLMGGCGQEEVPDSEEGKEGIPTETLFSISARKSLASSTRAEDGKPADPISDNEKITDWTVVFIDRSGKVAKIIKRPSEKNGTAVEQETFRCILPSGTYQAFAFANMSAEELTEAAGVSFTEGTTLDATALSAIKTAVTDPSKFDLNLWNITEKALPMSGYRGTLQVKNTIEETFSIEVVRMAAKVELRFSNPGEQSITVNSVSLDPVTTSAISLFPNGSTGISYSHLGMEAYTALEGTTYARLVSTPNGELAVGAGTSTVSHTFFINESLSDKANDNAFTVGLNVSHTDGIQEHQQYNITKDIRGYINRNDWIVIPITLSQYDVSVEALFYPPIGGYPALLTTTDPDGSQVFTFGTQGAFSIVPHVIDKQVGTHLSADKYSIELGTISDPANIFAQALTVTTTAASIPDEITGRLSTAKGKATVELKVKIGTDKTYTRKIYIIRANSDNS